MTQQFYSVVNNANAYLYGKFTNKEDAQMLADQMNDEAKHCRNFQIYYNVDVVEFEDEPTMTKSEKNGKYTYIFNGKVFRNSKKDYRWALMFRAVKAMGACNDGVFYPIALGNNPNTMISSWKSIYSYGELKPVEIK